MPSEIALQYSKYALKQEKFYYSWITTLWILFYVIHCHDNQKHYIPVHVHEGSLTGLYITRTVKYLYSFPAVLNCTFTLTCYWVGWTMIVTYLFHSVAFYTCSHSWGDQMSESSIKERVENVLWSMLKTKIFHTSFITQFLFPTTLNNFRRFCVIIYM